MTSTPTAANPRVVVVGVGAVTSLGPTADDLWQGARDGRVAIDPVQGFDMSAFRTKIAGQVRNFGFRAAGARLDDGSRERALDLAEAAAVEAFSVIEPSTIAGDRLAVVLGTCNAGLLSAREWLRQEVAGEPVDPRLAAHITPGQLADALARRFDATGPVLAVNTACASGANAIGLAADLVRSGRADAVLAGGTDALSDVTLAGFNSLEALSPLPAAPYSGNRQGLSLGEGSGMLLLMSEQLAQAHGLTVLAEVLGYGLSADGYDPTSPRPDGSGAAMAITAAMDGAGVRAEEVGYINGHGTGTAKNDPAESTAIGLAFGAGAAALLVSSTKSMIGHLLGAAGAVEAIVTIGALVEQIAPPTAGYETPDPDCPLNYVPNRHAPLTTNVALSNNFAFGGANACLALGRSGAPDRIRPRPGTERVVVTGVGLLHPAGDGVDAAFGAYAARRDTHHLLDGIRRGRLDVDPSGHLDRRQRRRMDRLSVFSVISAAQALIQAGITPGDDAAARCGVIFGTGLGPTEAMERFVVPLLGDLAAADPGVFPNTVYNQAAGQVAMHLGLRGPTSTVSVGHASGAAAVAYAADLIRSGRAETLVATVTDTLTDRVARAYLAAGLASDRDDEDPADGRFAVAEASVSLVLESRSAAKARGAAVLAEIAGAGFAGNGCRAGWDSRGSGMEKAIRAALRSAGIAPMSVGDVWLAAAGHRAVDRGETRAVERVFRSAGGALHCHAPKIWLGEALGASGSMMTALAVRRWSDDEPKPALINTSSLSGSHICLVVTPPDPDDAGAQQ